MQKEVEMQQVRDEAENADRALHSLAGEKAELQSLVRSLDERPAEQETKSSGQPRHWQARLKHWPCSTTSPSRCSTG